MISCQEQQYILLHSSFDRKLKNLARNLGKKVQNTQITTLIKRDESEWQQVKNKSYQFTTPDSLVNSTITDLKNCDLGQSLLS